MLPVSSLKFMESQYNIAFFLGGGGGGKEGVTMLNKWG